MSRLLDKTTLKGMVLLVALGLGAGLVSNLVAGPTRHLEWDKNYPPKGKPNCPETLPEPGQASAATAEPVAVPAESGTTAPAAEPVAGVAATSEPAAAPGSDPQPATPDPQEPPAGATAAAATPPVPAPASAPVSAAAPVAAPVAAPSPAAATESVDVPAVPPDKAWIELAPAQVDALFDRGALFVDARMTTQYQEGHIAGAVAIPIWESGVEDKVAQVVFDVQGDKAHPIVVYCNGGDCEDSHNLGQQLWEAGHTAVYVYKDGYPDWLKRGRPVRTGDAR